MTERHIGGPLPRPLRERLERVVVAHGWTSRAIWAIKLLHTVIFVLMSCGILYTTYSGLRNRVTRLTVLSYLAVLGEGLVLALNHRRCPMTDVVEDLGAEHGSVSDIFLPDWAARRIPQCLWLVVAGGGAFAWHRGHGRLAHRVRG